MKALFLRALVLGVFVEALVISLLSQLGLLQSSKGMTVLGSCAIVFGLVLMFAFFRFSFNDKQRLLRYSLIANPSASMIFAGASILLAWRIELMAAMMIFAIALIFLGIFFLTRYLRTKAS